MILVGDPQQLPPTVLSKAACAGLSQSLFERLQLGGAAAAMLRFQYRMHPAISAFPRDFFYRQELLDGTNAEDQSASFHYKVCLMHPRYFFLACEQIRGIWSHFVFLSSLAACPLKFHDATKTLLMRPRCAFKK